MLEKPNVSLVFDRRKKASMTEHGSVELMIYYQGKRKYVSTGVLVLKYQWENGCVVDHPRAKELNEGLKAALIDATKRSNAMIDAGIIDIKQFNPSEIINKVRKANFLDWMESQIIEDNVEESTRRQRLVVLNSLREFSIIQTFEDLTPQNIFMWNRFLEKSGNRQTTIHGYHKRLKVYVNRAVMLDMLKENPYHKMPRIHKGESESIRYLTDEQRDAIMNLPLNSFLEKARDMFVFSCFTGLAYADMCKITKEDIIMTRGRMMIKDKRVKTQVPYNITLLGPAEAILKKYNYKLDLLSNQKANLYLKTIAILAGINTNLTFHMARHTFATWALGEGISIATVSKMLGHTNIKQTEHYAKVLQKTVDKGFEILESKIPKDRRSFI